MPAWIKIPYTVKLQRSQQRFLCASFALKQVVYLILYRQYNVTNPVERLLNIRVSQAVTLEK